jgi:hypothetical protein
VNVLLNPSFVSIAAFSQTAVQNSSQIMNCSWGVNARRPTGTVDLDRAIRDADSVAVLAGAGGGVFGR